MPPRKRMVVAGDQSTLRALVEMAKTEEGRAILAKPLEHNMLFSTRKFPLKFKSGKRVGRKGT